MAHHSLRSATRHLLIFLAAILTLGLFGLVPRQFASAQPYPPQPYSPAYGASGVQNPVTVAWYPSYGTVAYDVAWADTANGQYTWSGFLYGQTSYGLPTLTAGDTYGWYVFACDYYSCVSGGQWYFTMASSGSSAPTAPQLSSPSNGANGVTNPVTFIWMQAGSDTNYIVYYEDATAGTGWSNSGLLGTQTTYSPASLNAGDTYYWAVYGCTNTCAASPVWYFTMASTAPTAPQLSSPADGASGVTNPVTLMWMQAGSDSGYVASYQDVSAGGGWVCSPWIAAPQTSYALPSLVAGHVYNWVVYGCTSSCVASPVWYFTMGP
jgi:hypothetical protein